MTVHNLSASSNDHELALSDCETKRLYDYYHFIYTPCIFISSMLDPLEIIETFKPKCAEHDHLPRQHKFNFLLNRLKERNLHNQILIKKFNKKMERKQYYPRETTQHINLHKEPHQKCITQIGEMNSKCAPPCLQTEDVEYCYLSPYKYSQNMRHLELLSTKDSTNQQPAPEQTKNTSFPNIEPAIKTKDYPLPDPKTRAPISLPKSDKDFTNYLKNTLLKEIVSKAQQNHRKNTHHQQEHPIKSYKERLTSKKEINHEKYQINIKSMVFGSEQAIAYPLDREESPPFKDDRTANNSYNKLKSFEKNKPANEFHDMNIVNEIHSFFPTINLNHVNRNKRGLQLFIRMNLDKSKYRSKINQPANAENDSTWQADSFAPVNPSFIINTIPLKKQN